MAMWILLLNTFLHGVDPASAATHETATADNGMRYAGIEQMFAKFAAERD